jgi:PRTRC genetic system protein B
MVETLTFRQMNDAQWRSTGTARVRFRNQWPPRATVTKRQDCNDPQEFDDDVRPMYLHPVDGKRKIVKVRWPTLAMYAVNRKLFLVGLEKDERPTPATKVFHAPLANIWASTQVCTGSAPLPLSCNTDSMAEWEHIVFETGFSHQNHEEVLRRPRGRAFIDPMDYWPKADKKTGAFPATQLTPLHLTMGKWLATVRDEA